MQMLSKSPNQRGFIKHEQEKDIGKKLTDILVGKDKGHRSSCHRCGNLRKKNILCSNCPQTYCFNCAIKMTTEHGDDIFVDGCPMCKEKCCCGVKKSPDCLRQFHCYKKCPSTKVTPRDPTGIYCSPALAKTNSPKRRSNRRLKSSCEDAYVDSVQDCDDDHTDVSGPESPFFSRNRLSFSPEQPSDISSPALCAPVQSTRVRDQTNCTTSSAESMPQHCTQQRSTNEPRMSSFAQVKNISADAQNDWIMESSLTSPPKRRKSFQSTASASHATSSNFGSALPFAHSQDMQLASLSGEEQGLFGSILEPRSLTLDINPFFLQSAIGPTRPGLQPIQPLLESTNEALIHSYFHPFDNSCETSLCDSGSGTILSDISSPCAMNKDLGGQQQSPIGFTPYAKRLQERQHDSSWREQCDVASANNLSYWDILDNMHNGLASNCSGDGSDLDRQFVTHSSSRAAHSGSFSTPTTGNLLFDDARFTPDDGGDDNDLRRLFQQNNRTIDSLQSPRSAFSTPRFTNHCPLGSEPQPRDWGEEKEREHLQDMGFGLALAYPLLADTARHVPEHRGQSQNSHLFAGAAFFHHAGMDVETYTLFSSLFNDGNEGNEGNDGNEGSNDDCAFTRRTTTPKLSDKQHRDMDVPLNRESTVSVSETPLSVYSCSSSVFDYSDSLIPDSTPENDHKEHRRSRNTAERLMNQHQCAADPHHSYALVGYGAMDVMM